MGRAQQFLHPGKAQGTPYYERMRTLNPVAYWQLGDIAGAASAVDVVAGNHGIPTGVVFGQPGIGYGKTSAYFGGSNENVDILIGSVASRFNYSAGSVVIWGKLTATEWTDGANRHLFYFGQNNNTHMFTIYKSATDNRVSAFAGTSLSQDMMASVGWMHFGLTWDLVTTTWTLYYKGTKRNSLATFPDYTGDTLGAAYIGRRATADRLWKGNLQYCALFDRCLTPAEMALTYTEAHAVRRISVLGDSISGNLAIPLWSFVFADQYADGWNYLMNHAVSGASIMAGDLAAQTAEAASDDADIIIVEFGTNDDNAGDMVALQAAVNASLAALKVSNPRASIYYMNVLPRAVDKALIRAAIVAACTAQGVTCWDTNTVPWIDYATDTYDGTHPNQSGVTKIVAEVVARL